MNLRQRPESRGMPDSGEGVSDSFGDMSRCNLSLIAKC